jgi:hypothetical protein
MELIVIKYMQLVCITIFMQNNADCAQLTTQGEEQNNLRVAACAANCLQTSPNLVSEDSLDFQISSLDFLKQQNLTFKLSPQSSRLSHFFLSRSFRTSHSATSGVTTKRNRSSTSSRCSSRTTRHSNCTAVARSDC